MTTETRCADCGHRHAGDNLAGICIGCPCPEYVPIAPPMRGLELNASRRTHANTPIVPIPVIGEANTSDHTAPRRTVTVDRAVIVAALDAWQGFIESEEIGDTDAAYDALHDAMAELNAEVRP